MIPSLSVEVVKTEGPFTLDVGFVASHGVTGIIGRSGAGKSMLLSAIAGLQRPDKGTIKLGNAPLFDRARNIDLSPEHRELGMVFQNARLFPHMTVKSNLIYSRRNTQASLATFDEVVDFHILEPHGRKAIVLLLKFHVACIGNHAWDPFASPYIYPHL